MPYIKDKIDRYFMDKTIKENYGFLKPTGNLNYFLHRLFLEDMKNRKMSYRSITNFLRELHEAECEIRRRYLIPYEDQKRKENGDIL